MLKIAAALALAAAVPAVLATGLVQATAYGTTECSGNVVATFAETFACVATPNSRALSIDNSTAGCQVFIYSDAACTGAAFVNLVNLSEKCHNTDSFNSVKVQCIQGGRR